MKSLKIIIISLLLITAGELLNSKKASAQATVSFQVFYDQLSPYGQWMDYPQYGYVWIPSGVHGFIPYSTSGHWIYTDLGWTWVSDFAWGWAPFHYGRWLYDDFYGWVWVPASEWGPAWVCWRHAPGYYGWTPMPPGVSLNVMFGPRFHVHHDRWIFVREGYVNSPRLTPYIAPRNENITIIKNSTVINNTHVDNSNHVTYITGPRRDDVQKVTGASIRPVAVKESAKPEQSLNNNELRIYRPSIQKTDAAGSKPAPKKVIPMDKSQPSRANNTADEKTIVPSARPADSPARNEGKDDSKQTQPQAKPSPAAPSPSQNIKRDDAKQPEQPEVNPAPSPVKKKTDINREPQPVRPKNTVDKSHERNYDQQKRITPVKPQRARPDKPGERR
jgi:uncharacterized protein DUF6600